jgi:hypothetical protein
MSRRISAVVPSLQVESRRSSRLTVDSSSSRPSISRASMARPERKTVTSSTELIASASLLLQEQSSASNATKTVNGLKALYASQRKHIWFTIAVLFALSGSFVIFERLYPQISVAQEAIGEVPAECKVPDANGCFDYETCIQPDFIDKPSNLTQPTCGDSKNECGYQCTCAETSPTQLTSADFAIARFLFFSPKVPLVQAGLGGALLLFFIATILMRKQRKTTEVQYVFFYVLQRTADLVYRYMAGTGKNDYEEWQLYAFPAKYTFQGVTMMVLFLAWTA